MKRSKWLRLVAVAMLVCSVSAFAAETTAPTPVKGNPDSKIYHKPACRHYNSKGSTKEFKSEAEAREAGYKPCKQCAAPKKEKKGTESSEKTE